MRLIHHDLSLPSYRLCTKKPAFFPASAVQPALFEFALQWGRAVRCFSKTLLQGTHSLSPQLCQYRTRSVFCPVIRTLMVGLFITTRLRLSNQALPSIAAAVHGNREAYGRRSRLGVLSIGPLRRSIERRRVSYKKNCKVKALFEL